MKETDLKVGITGGTGFVGSYIIRELLRHGYHDITAIRRQDSNNQLVADLDNKVQWQEADILDIPSIESAFRQVDIIIHAAALVSLNDSDKWKMKKVNIEGTRNMVNIALDRKIKKFIYLSSVAAIGRSDDMRQIDEDTKWQEDALNSTYAISKRQAELEVWRGFAEGLSTIILNPTIVLGAAYWDKGSAAIIPNIIQGVPFYPRGSTGVVDVRDVARAVAMAISSDKNGERYILNAGNLSYLQLFEKVCDIASKKVPSFSIPSWSHSILSWMAKASSWFTGKKPIITRNSLRISSRHFHYDGSKAARELGVSYRPIDQTIRETTEKYLQSLENNQSHGLLHLAH